MKRCQVMSYRRIVLMLVTQLICFGHGFRTFRQRHNLNAASRLQLQRIVTASLPPLVQSGRLTKTSLSSIRSLSLDSSILPGHKLVGGGSGASRLVFLVVLTLLALRNVFPSVISSLRSFAFSDGEEHTIDHTSNNITPSVMEIATSAQKVVSSIISYADNTFMKTVSKLSGLCRDIYARVLSLTYRTEVVQLDDWKVCSLKSRELLSGGRYCRYRFELENGGATIPLYIGQELTLCSTDAKDRVLKESFSPISPPSARGFFEILVKRSPGSGAAIGSYGKFSRLLDTLEEGDEVAFKGGSYKLNYTGDDDPIKYITVISSGLGISPAIQMMQGILSDKESTVEDLELLWANTDKKDFVCEKYVENLETKYKDKLFVSKVLHENLFGRDVDFARSDDILGGLSAYERSRIAVICGTDVMISKFRQFLASVGYPPETILSITSE